MDVWPVGHGLECVSHCSYAVTSKRIGVRQAEARMAGLQNVLNHPTLRIELSQGEDGYIVAECLDIAGCALQGKTREEALANILESTGI